MFIKVSEDLVVNTDHISVINVGENTAELFFNSKLRTRDGDSGVIISRESALYLLSLVESNTALAELPSDPPSLTSRIAQALRDNYPNGATADELAVLTGADPTAIYEALGSLLQETVIVFINPADTASDQATIIYHVSNAPKLEVEALPLADFNARETLYHWDCKSHTPAHLNSVIVSGKDFQAGILYCDLCGSSHVVDDKVLALHGAPVIPSPDL